MRIFIYKHTILNSTYLKCSCVGRQGNWSYFLVEILFSSQPHFGRSKSTRKQSKKSPVNRKKHSNVKGNIASNVSFNKFSKLLRKTRVKAAERQPYKITLLSDFIPKARSCQSTSASHIDQRFMSAFRSPVYISALIEPNNLSFFQCNTITFYFKLQ